jgi:hypothetical protein
MIDARKNVPHRPRRLLGTSLQDRPRLRDPGILRLGAGVGIARLFVVKPTIVLPRKA